MLAVRALAGLALMSVLTASCSRDGGTAATGSSTPDPPAAPSSSAPEPIDSSTEPARGSAGPSAAAQPGLASDVVRSAEPSGGPLTVTAVRVARQDGFDRVVLELAGSAEGVPGWRIGYENDPRRDGSGDPVDVQGASVLVVRVLGAGYPFDTGQTEASSVSVPADTGVVQDVVLGSVFEGTYEAFVGVRSQTPFQVTRLADPTRLAVDIEHP